FHDVDGDGVYNPLNVDYREFDIAGTIERLIKLSSIINIPESEYTPCHNDLLADNFILINEEAVHKYDAPMYIIDWEYAGMAPKYYDIGDMFQEILVPREAEKQIVEEYCAGYRFDHVLYHIDLFKPFPDIYWFLWSLIQLNISKIEFDYYNYGKTKYDNACTVITLWIPVQTDCLIVFSKKFYLPYTRCGTMPH
ncbi:hypothetical protein LCGC14_2011730, partial [marine sediment metagenome]